jgi:hypothetical protein
MRPATRSTGATGGRSLKLGARRESFQAVGSLVLRADGGVAWIGTRSSIVGGRKLVEVRKADRSGAALLDSGPAVDSGSLRLRGSKLTWKHGGRIRSATLQ